MKVTERLTMCSRIKTTPKKKKKRKKEKNPNLIPGKNAPHLQLYY
jgi:hypothetical protein